MILGIGGSESETARKEPTVSADLKQELVSKLSQAHAIEQQALQLLKKGGEIAGDEEISRIYRAHHLQTEEHARYVAERLQAHGESPSKIKDTLAQVGALGIGALAQGSPETPSLLPRVAYAFENFEIATYEMLKLLAQRAGDTETVAVADRILEEERAAAELVAGTFERALELDLGEPARTPIPGVTPLGRPSERDDSGHQGPQDFKDKGADDTIAQPPAVEDESPRGPAEENPDPGYPTDDVQPYGGEVPRPEHPQPLRHPGGS